MIYFTSNILAISFVSSYNVSTSFGRVRIRQRTDVSSFVLTRLLFYWLMSIILLFYLNPYVTFRNIIT
jgi:hypothetical protein